jgi:hypothetical protein
MKNISSLLLSCVLCACLCAQTAPPSLKYFGYAVVDCGFDDPNDIGTMTNYITEVDSFSNIAQLCVNDYTDTVIPRVNLMNAHCVVPILSTSSIFYYLANNNAPSGSNYDLYPNYLARWNAFKNANASVLDSSKIGMIYVVDEPTWNGVTFGELDTVCTLLKNDLPGIPLIFVEAWPVLNSLQVPTSMDFIGFDRYGIYDVSTDTTFLNELATLKSKRSATDQKIFLVVDDQYTSGYASNGWSQDTMQYVVQHYYDLAVADTSIIGLAGFTWPGLAVGWLGVRNMTQAVINKNVQIGKMIKANYNPCTFSAVHDVERQETVKIFPNPAPDILNIEMKTESSRKMEIFNSLGSRVVVTYLLSDKDEIDLRKLPSGIYFYRITGENGTSFTGKIVKE